MESRVMSTEADDSPRPLGEIERLGVYQIYTGRGTGSGFLIDSRHLVTNCHVVAPYREVAVELRDRSRIIATVRRLNPQRDLALLELVREVDGEILPLAEADDLRSKQPVHILGFPVGLPLSVTEGVVSHPRQMFDEQFFLQTDAAINPGNSGGPMLDEALRVIAVTTCKISSAESVGFGIPVADVRRFVGEFRAQTAAFGVQCPACDELLDKPWRYCPNCGSELEARHGFDEYFVLPEPDPLTGFVETALAGAGIDPVLARHGEQNWSFHSGSAPIKVWCCCSEHLNFSSPMVQVGNRGLNELFAFLLAPEHAPFAFDLYGRNVRMNLVVHIGDVFAAAQHAELASRVREFLRRADELDSMLVKDYGCTPAPDSQLEALVGDEHPLNTAAA